MLMAATWSCPWMFCLVRSLVIACPIAFLPKDELWRRKQHAKFCSAEHIVRFNQQRLERFELNQAILCWCSLCLHASTGSCIACFKSARRPLRAARYLDAGPKAHERPRHSAHQGLRNSLEMQSDQITIEISESALLLLRKRLSGEPIQRATKVKARAQ